MDPFLQKIAHVLKPMGNSLQEQIFIYFTDIQSYGYEISDEKMYYVPL